MKAKSVIFASAAAAMFIAGGAGIAAAEDGAAKIKCEGVNSCKGKSACKTADNECAGHNSCKGKGFVMLSEAECEAAKAEK